MKIEEAWLLLSHVFYMRVSAADRLLSHYSRDPQAAFSEKNRSFLSGIIGESLTDTLLSLDKNAVLDSLQQKVSRSSIRVIHRESLEYPDLLKEIFDPPLVLFAKGKTLRADFWGIAIVGTRYATEYGKRLAFEHAKALSENGVPVVSGLARGIDTEAHRGALTGSAGTVAVLGSGLDWIYPKENSQLSGDITRNGTLLSEFCPGTAPLSIHFPFRNRVVSGLSKGIVVIEAPQRSGSLITASTALDQNRLLFAVPGRPHDKNSEGANRLIQMGARMVLSAEDILSELEIDSLPFKSSVEAVLKNLSSEEALIYANFGDEPRHVDHLLDKNPDLSQQRLSYLLLKLEMKNLLKRLPGDFWVHNYTTIA
jgi:DNA processing protein